MIIFSELPLEISHEIHKFVEGQRIAELKEHINKYSDVMDELEHNTSNIRWLLDWRPHVLRAKIYCIRRYEHNTLTGESKFLKMKWKIARVRRDN